MILFAMFTIMSFIIFLSGEKGFGYITIFLGVLTFLIYLNLLREIAKSNEN